MFDENKLEKSGIEKTPVLKNRIGIQRAEKINFETKNNHFEKSHNAKNCKCGDLSCFLEIQFAAKFFLKIERGTLQPRPVLQKHKNVAGWRPLHSHETDNPLSKKSSKMGRFGDSEKISEESLTEPKKMRVGNLQSRPVLQMQEKVSGLSRDLNWRPLGSP